MGILTRMMTLWKADMHGVMDQIEDKPLLLKQYLREMEESLREKERRLEQLQQNERQMQRDVDLRVEELGKIEKDLDLALRKEKDDIAKMLIRKRRIQQGAREQMRRRIEASVEERQKLIELLNRQRLQYDQLKIKAAAACMQAEQARIEDNGMVSTAGTSWSVPTDEEIELELLQRKEQLRKGGEA